MNPNTRKTLEIQILIFPLPSFLFFPIFSFQLSNKCLLEKLKILKGLKKINNIIIKLLNCRIKAKYERLKFFQTNLQSIVTVDVYRQSYSKVTEKLPKHYLKYAKTLKIFGKFLKIFITWSETSSLLSKFLQNFRHISQNITRVFIIFVYVHIKRSHF